MSGVWSRVVLPLPSSDKPARRPWVGPGASAASRHARTRSGEPCRPAAVALLPGVAHASAVHRWPRPAGSQTRSGGRGTARRTGPRHPPTARRGTDGRERVRSPAVAVWRRGRPLPRRPWTAAAWASRRVGACRVVAAACRQWLPRCGLALEPVRPRDGGRPARPRRAGRPGGVLGASRRAGGGGWLGLRKARGQGARAGGARGRVGAEQRTGADANSLRSCLALAVGAAHRERSASHTEAVRCIRHNLPSFPDCLSIQPRL